MKKAILILALVIPLITSAQSVVNYLFSASGGTYVPLSGASGMALSGGNTDDGWFNDIPLGFTFYYMGAPFTKVSASTKGWMTFGQTISNAAYTNSLTSGGTRPLIAPLWDDHNIQDAANFSWKTEGAAPARKFTAQWTNVRWKNTATSGGISFQVSLYEADSRLEFIYHPEGGTLSSPSASIGIAALATGAGNFLSLSNATASPSISSTTETTTIATKPADGQVYTFTPPSGIPAAPTALTFSDITKTSMTINWTDNSTSETWFTLFSSPDGITWTQAGTVPSTTFSGTGTGYSFSRTGLLPGQTYYYRISANNEGNPPSGWLSGSQSTSPPVEIVSVTNGNWTNTATWSTGSVPTSLDNVTIADGNTVIVDGAADCNALTVGQGTSAILRFGTTATSLNIVHGVTINPGGLFDAGASAGANLTHNLRVGGTTPSALGTGSLTVNGTLDMYIGSSNGKCILSFFGIPDATISGTGTLDFYRTVVNKGTVPASASVIPPVLEVLRTWTGSGSATTGFVYTHTAGTVKIGGTYSFTNPVFMSTGYDIPLNGGIWLNNPNFTVSGLGASPTNNGVMRISAGTYNVGTNSSHTMTAGTGAVFVIEGGVLNFTARLNIANAVSWIQSGGTVNVSTVGNTTSNAPGFGLNHVSSSFTMSGGIICLVKANTGTIKIDYLNNASTNLITGGLLQLGNASLSAAQLYHIRGTAPNVTLTSFGGNHGCNLAGALTVSGDLTLNSTGTFNNNGNSLTLAGMSTSNPGNIILGAGSILTLNNGASASLLFTGTFGNQSLSGSGTITSGQLAGLTVNNTSSGGGTVTIPGGLSMTGDATLNLARGILNTASGLTMGTGGTAGFTVVIGDGTVTGTLTKNFGSGIVNYTYNGINAATTGSELPASITGTLTIANNAGVTLGSALLAGKLAMNAGTLYTTSSNSLTITGTSPADLTYAGGMINGPLRRILPANLSAGTTYLFPLGKTVYRPFELVDPLTGSGGSVTLSAEVFDADAGGVAGTTMVSLNPARYWKAEIPAGGANFTSTRVRLTESGLTGNSGIAKSLAQTGTYELVSPDPPSGNTLTTGSLTLPGYFVTGEKRMNYTGSTTLQPNTAIVREGSVNQEIVSLQVNTSGNLDPAILTSLTFTTNGTTRTADLAAARVYYTGASNVFAPTNPFGSAVNSPSGTMVFNGSQSLTEGANYFWLAYDIAMGVVDNDLADAECLSVTVRGVSYTPDIQAPAGSRTIRAALSGTVTVGTSGTFQTLTGTDGLFDRIALVGLKGNLTATVLSDITEPGTNALQPWYEAGAGGYYLTITPGSATLVTLSGTYTGGLIRLNKVARVKIDGRFNAAGKYLAIRNLATTGTIAALQLIGTAAGQGCSDILIRNCLISAGHNGTGAFGISIGGATPGNAGYDNDGVTLQKCIISKAAVGIFASGNASAQNNNLVITGDSIGSYVAGNEITRYGIDIQQCPGASLSGNTIFNIVNTASDPMGVRLTTGCSGSTVSGNLITGISRTGTTFNGATGLYLGPGYGTGNMTVINNIISDIKANGSFNLASDGIAGIRIANGTGYSIWYNSVNLSGTVNHTTTSSDVSAAIFLMSEGGVDLRNNIFRNSLVNATGPQIAHAIYSVMPRAGFTDINFNDYFATGTQARLGYCDYSVASDIYQWRLITLKDVYSIATDPLFKSETDLHPDFTSPVVDAGTPIAGVTTDFDGVTRDVSTPTLGALETAVDGQGPVISYIPLQRTSSTAARTLQANITDLTGVPTSGPGLPVLYWNINHGTWNAATALWMGGSTYQFTFGSGASPGDSVFYFVAAQDILTSPNVSTQPAGGSGFTSNPPACATKPSSPNAYRIAVQLSGTLTVGTGGNYPSLTGTGGVFHAINSNVVSGNLNVQVISDLTETGTYGLLPFLEEGAGNYAIRITPGSATEKLIAGNVTQGMIRIEGASRVIFDGRFAGSGSWLRIRNTSTTATATIHLLNGATYDTLRNCIFEGSTTLSTGATLLFGTSATTGNRYNVIMDCTIRDRSDALGTPVSGIGSTGTTGKENGYNTIRGNHIYNFTNYGVFIGSTGNTGYWNISENHFYNTLATPPASLQRSISLIAGDLAGFNTISGNYIGGQAPLCGGASWVNSGTSLFHGINLSVSPYDYSSVTGNVITNISLTNSNANELIGISLSNGTATITGNTLGNPDPALSLRSNSQDYNRKFIGIRILANTYFNVVESNTITNLILTNTTGYTECAGIFLTSGDVLKNKITGIGTVVNASMSPYIRGIYLYGSAGCSNEIFNNLIILSGGISTDADIFGIYEESFDNCTYWIYHNSVSITGPANSSSNTAAFYRSTDADIFLKNNSLANFRAQQAFGGTNYVMYLDITVPCFGDYNDLFCQAGFTGYSNSTNYTTLADWQTATGTELHSLAMDPLYVSNTGDLHPQTGSPLAAAGTGLPEVPSDLDGNPRDPADPTIGCYESAYVPDKTWNGNLSLSWDNAANWTPSGVPGPTDDILIPGGRPFQCAVPPAGRACGRVLIEATAVLTISSGGTLTANGTFVIRTGGNLVNDGTLILKGDFANEN